MPRKPRLFLPGATYHLYCRVARGEYVFDDRSEAIEFIDVVKKVEELDAWTIYAWCLMGDHYHLVPRTRTVDLWRSMARLQGRVSRKHNRRHRYLGRLWQIPYRARVIDSDDYFRQVVCYVHLNAVAAGIVDDPADYPYSGHRELLGFCNLVVIDRQSAFEAFCPSTQDDLAVVYLEWIQAVAEAKWSTFVVEDLPWWRRPKDPDEIADPERHPDATTYDGSTLAENRAKIDLQYFAVRFEEAAGNTVADLSSRSRSKNQILGRLAIAPPRPSCQIVESLGLAQKTALPLRCNTADPGSHPRMRTSRVQGGVSFWWFQKTVPDTLRIREC